MSSDAHQQPQTKDDGETIKKAHLGWSAKQSRILTGGGKAEEYYTVERGFPFTECELPHYHLLKGETDSAFQEWRQAMFASASAGDDNADDANHNKVEDNGDVLPAAKKAKTGDEQADSEVAESATSTTSTEKTTRIPLVPVVGAWTRLLFFGGWEHTSIKDERTFNLQTNNLFIDLRIPRTRGVFFPSATNVDKTTTPSSLEDLNKEQLRLYARQHVFAGYTQVCKVSTPIHQEDLLCTRHHCIDWNFVGTPRPRPNKWWAELQQQQQEPEQQQQQQQDGLVHTWKEWAFATDDRGQHYYCEQWERVPGGDQSQILALRRSEPKERDGMILIIGDHFNYIMARDLSGIADLKQPGHASLVNLVDDLLDRDDLQTAKAYLSTRAGHGTISSGWTIDCAIEPWKEGTVFWGKSDDIDVKGHHVRHCQLLWNGEAWDVFDTTLETVEGIKKLVIGNLK